MASNKFILPVILGVALGSVLTWGIINFQAPDKPAETPDKPTENPVDTSNSICMDYPNEPMSTLDADLVHEMTDGYKDYQLKYIERATGTTAPQDAFSIWFDLETLKKFLYNIESISKKNDSTITSEDLGVRMYYAAYPNKDIMNKFPDLKISRINPNISKYIGLHTLVMIPTVLKDSVDVDFNPLDNDTYDKGLSVIKKYAKGYPGSIPNNTAALSGTSVYSRNTGARNHGILVPPGLTTGFGF